MHMCVHNRLTCNYNYVEITTLARDLLQFSHSLFRKSRKMNHRLKFRRSSKLTY